MINVCNRPLMYIASFWNLGPRWPTCGKLTGFPILNIWRPFHSHITGVNDSSWTCILMNNVCNGPLMYLASFWNLSPRLPTSRILRDFPHLKYGDFSKSRCQHWMTWGWHAFSWTLSVMTDWCSYPYLEILVQDGRPTGNDRILDT